MTWTTSTFALAMGSESRRVAASAGFHSTQNSVRLGFLQHVETMRAAGHTRVFPELRPDPHGRLTDAFGKWFTRYCRAVGAKSAKTCFHSGRTDGLTLPVKSCPRNIGTPSRATSAGVGEATVVCSPEGVR